MANTLSALASEALRTAEATGTSITLRCGQLDRKTYVEVNKALTRIGGGGLWDRRAGATELQPGTITAGAAWTQPGQKWSPS